jgi:hypothetical protein
MSLDTVSLLAAVQSHAQSLGLFEQVLLHEPENAPDNGLIAACWLNDGTPIPQLSGMISTSWRVQVTVRIYLNLLTAPQDGNEALIAGANDALVANYSSGFTLAGLLEEVDLLGSYGAPLSWKLQYATHNHKLYRIATIALPLVVADVYPQGA